MIITAFPISYRWGETIKIKPIFDVHLGNTACDVKSFKKYLDERDRNTYFFGGGDLFDSIIIKDTKRYRKAADASKGDAVIDEQVDLAEELLSPIKSRLIGLGKGNHEETIIPYGSDMIKRLCRRLDCTPLGYSGLIKLILTDKGARSRVIVIRFHHGHGGGSRTLGADLTKYSRDVMYWEADVFLYGHVHRKQTDRIPRMGLSGLKLISKPKLIGICGTYLKTYLEGTDTTYSEKAGYPPTEIGSLTLNIKPKSNWVDMWIDL